MGWRLCILLVCGLSIVPLSSAQRLEVACCNLVRSQVAHGAMCQQDVVSEADGVEQTAHVGDCAGEK